MVFVGKEDRKDREFVAWDCALIPDTPREPRPLIGPLPLRPSAAREEDAGRAWLALAPGVDAPVEGIDALDCVEGCVGMLLASKEEEMALEADLGSMLGFRREASEEAGARCVEGTEEAEERKLDAAVGLSFGVRAEERRPPKEPRGRAMLSWPSETELGWVERAFWTRGWDVAEDMRCDAAVSCADVGAREGKRDMAAPEMGEVPSSRLLVLLRPGRRMTLTRDLRSARGEASSSVSES